MGELEYATETHVFRKVNLKITYRLVATRGITAIYEVRTLGGREVLVPQLRCSTYEEGRKAIRRAARFLAGRGFTEITD